MKQKEVSVSELYGLMHTRPRRRRRLRRRQKRQRSHRIVSFATVQYI